MASVGTGGTVSGTARYLKAQNAGDPGHRRRPGGLVLSGDTARPYLTEGVGEDFFPGTYDPAVVDRWVRVSDRDAFAMARRITREEGILAGESCGTAMVAALDEAAPAHARGARRRRRDAVIVVILPDGGRNYLSKLYNDEWMRANGLLSATGAVDAGRGAARAPGTTASRSPDVVLARTTDRVGAAIDLLQEYGISQLPVSEQPDGDALEGIVGSVSEKGLLDRAYRDPDVVERTVGEVMDRPLPDDRRHGDARRGVRAAVRGGDRAARRARRAPGRGRHQARPARVPRPPRLTPRPAAAGGEMRSSPPMDDDRADRDAFATRAVHAGAEPDELTGAVSPPIYQTSTFAQAGVGQPRNGYEYARSQNPTRERLERAVADLEGGTHGIAFASGSAATAAIAQLAAAGEEILVGDDVYGGTFRYFERVHRPAGAAVGALRGPRRAPGRAVGGPQRADPPRLARDAVEPAAQGHRHRGGRGHPPRARGAGRPRGRCS